MLSLLPLIALAFFFIIFLGTAALVRGIARPPRKTYADAVAAGLPGDPADIELHARELTLTLTDESRTPGWVIQGDRADGPTVLIVHGHGDSRLGSLTWVGLVRTYASEVVVFDLPGHGESQARSSQGGMREPGDVLKVIDQISPEQAVVLFGYSLGAQIAIAAAAKDAEEHSGRRIAGVIADGPYRYWDQPIARLLAMKRYPQQPFIFLAGLFFRITLPGFAQFDRAEKARQMRCPLLILHGTEDELCPYQAAKEIAEAAPNARLITFEGGHHLDLAEREPDRYRAELERFLNDLRQTTHRGE